jgi:hypothetical protein
MVTFAVLVGAANCRRPPEAERPIPSVATDAGPQRPEGSSNDASVERPRDAEPPVGDLVPNPWNVVAISHDGDAFWSWRGYTHNSDYETVEVVVRRVTDNATLATRVLETPTENAELSSTAVESLTRERAESFARQLGRRWLRLNAHLALPDREHGVCYRNVKQRAVIGDLTVEFSGGMLSMRRNEGVRVATRVTLPAPSDRACRERNRRYLEQVYVSVRHAVAIMNFDSCGDDTCPELPAEHRAFKLPEKGGGAKP